MSAIDLNQCYPSEEDGSHWRALLSAALRPLDYAFPEPRKPGEPPPWTLGGGTALAMVVEHRVSYDIDIFISGKGLREFQPERNPMTMGVSGSHPGFRGDFMKFIRPDGEIDFLSSHPSTDDFFFPATFEGREIAVEKPLEIIAKTIRYRGSQFKPRDVFDLAAVARAYPVDTPASIARYAPDMLGLLRDSIEHVGRLGPREIAEAVKAPAPDFADLHKTAVDECLAVVARAHAQHDRDVALGAPNQANFRPRRGPTAADILRGRAKRDAGDDDDGRSGPGE